MIASWDGNCSVVVVGPPGVFEQEGRSGRVVDGVYSLTARSGEGSNRSFIRGLGRVACSFAGRGLHARVSRVATSSGALV